MSSRGGGHSNKRRGWIGGERPPSRHLGLFEADFMRELDAVITYTENRIFLIQR